MLSRIKDRVWWGPDDPRASVFLKLYSKVWRCLPDAVSKNAIDLGSGNGAILEILQAKGYWPISAIENDPEKLEALGKVFPVRVWLQDCNITELYKLSGRFDVATMIFTAQYLSPEELDRVLRWLRVHARMVVIDVTNSHSFHEWWMRARGFYGDWKVYPMTPAELDRALHRAGFRVKKRYGVGLLTPVTWLPGFKVQVVPGWLARAVNCLDRFFWRWCHLYLVVAE